MPTMTAAQQIELADIEDKTRALRSRVKLLAGRTGVTVSTAELAEARKRSRQSVADLSSIESELHDLDLICTALERHLAEEGTERRSAS